MFGKEKAGQEQRPDLKEPLQCSFCQKRQDRVKKLIAGPAAFICDECVAVCVDIMADDDRWAVHQEAERLRVKMERETERVRALRATLRRDSGVCTLCGKVASADKLLSIGARGSLCGDCANAVEDALAMGKPFNDGAV